MKTKLFEVDTFHHIEDNHETHEINKNNIQQLSCLSWQIFLLTLVKADKKILR